MGFELQHVTNVNLEKRDELHLTVADDEVE